MSSLSTASGLLDYFYPGCLLAMFVVTLVFDWFTLRTANNDKKVNRGRRTALTLTFIVFLTYAGQVILNLVHALQNRKWDAPEHTIIGTLGNAFAWGVLSASLSSIASPCWDPFIGSWVLGLSFEATIFGLRAPSVDRNVYGLIRAILQGVRITALVFATFNTLRLAPSKRQMSKKEDEAEPLLAGSTATANDGAATTATGYGSVESAPENEDSDGEADPDKELKEQQRKRLEAHGGWWGYIKEFKIFIPYLVPYKNRKVQACVVIILLNMVLDRFVNVMVPRQVGIITDELANNYSVMPWKAVLFWVFLRWLNSFASFGLLSDIAHTHLHNWSSSQIKGLAFRHVMSLSMDFHSNKDSGDVIKSIGQAESLNDLLETMFFELLPIFIDVFIAFIYITHLFDGAMAMVILMVGFMFVWTSITTTTRTRPKRRVYTEKSRAESKTLYECISNWPTISYFNRTTYEEDRYSVAVKEEMSAQLRYYISSSLGYAVQYLIIYAGLLTVSLMAIFQISEGRKPIGNFVTLVMYWSTMMSPLHMITYQYRRISGATVDAERLLGLLQTEPTIKNKIDAKPLAVEKGQVVFNDVGFSYDDRKTTLKGLDFTVEPGQTLALVGETGGGKSSTLKLLFRFYDVKEGSITIDGQDIREVTVESLRQELGVVPQDPSLFNQTIMENVRYARLEASDEEVIEACKAAAVHDKIVSFPDQYRSKVGERGVKLSGGELQRVAIARVILKNPKIVLLDEATSAVDSAIEAQIQAAFKKLSAGRTTFVVAHRLSTIMEANLILVIDQGEIIERGTHEELIRNGKKYFELWTKQTTGSKSKTGSKANSILDVPSDGGAQIENDLTPGAYSDEIRKAFIPDSESDDTLFQVDGACESKVEEAGCFPKRKQKATTVNEDGAAISASSSDGGDGPIRMISAKPTTATTTSTATAPLENTGPQTTAAPPRIVTPLTSVPPLTAVAGSTLVPASAMAISKTPQRRMSVMPQETEQKAQDPDEEPPSITLSCPGNKIPSGPSTRTPSIGNGIAPEAPALRIQKETSSSEGSAEELPVPKPRSIRGRKATGYPKDMPPSPTMSPTASKGNKGKGLLPVASEASSEYSQPSLKDFGNELETTNTSRSEGNFDSTKATRHATEQSSLASRQANAREDALAGQDAIARNGALVKEDAKAHIGGHAGYSADDEDGEDIRALDRFDTASEGN